MIQLFNRLIIMDIINWETNCHIKWQFWFGFCRFVVLYSIYCAYWRVQVLCYKYNTSKWHFQNIRWEKKRLLKSKLWLKNGWPSKPAFWSAFWHIQVTKCIVAMIFRWRDAWGHWHDIQVTKCIVAMIFRWQIAWCLWYPGDKMYHFISLRSKYHSPSLICFLIIVAPTILTG